MPKAYYDDSISGNAMMMDNLAFLEIRQKV